MITETKIDDILAHPFDHEWSIQGFGMLRTYLDDEHVGRLHIWDASSATVDVSTIHDHPWDFTSRIVRGYLSNRRYRLMPEGCGPVGGGYVRAAKIRCGEGGGIVEDLGRARIGLQTVETFGPEETYSMLAPELHESYPVPGTVSIIERTFHAEKDIATVCWLEGEWVSAEPRPATREEIARFINLTRG